MHRRTYKPLRSRLEHGLGSTPSASTNAFEAHEDEQAILNRQAVGSIPTGRTKFWNCGRMVRRSTFNRDGESSILSSSTRICRRRLVDRIADFQLADGSSILLAGTICPVRPMDQDRTLRTFRFGFESRAGYQVYGVVAERQRHLTVYED